MSLIRRLKTNPPNSAVTLAPTALACLHAAGRPIPGAVLEAGKPRKALRPALSSSPNDVALTFEQIQPYNRIGLSERAPPLLDNRIGLPGAGRAGNRRSPTPVSGPVSLKSVADGRSAERLFLAPDAC